MQVILLKLMSNLPEPLTRRAFVRNLGYCSVAALDMWAPPPIRYSVRVVPANALLGDQIVAYLDCVVLQEGIEVFTFQDASLELALRRMPTGSEPMLAFPNRSVTQNGSLEIHNHPTGRLRATNGQRLSRKFELVSLYPRWMLDTGEYEFSYQLGPGEPSWGAAPARLKVESGPAAIPRLFSWLDFEDAGVRARAAGLIHRMTAHVAGYDAGAAPGERTAAIARWREWWGTTGETMPWNFLSPGATFGVAIEPPTSSGRSRFLGGVAYQLRPLDPASARVFASVLAEWLRTPSAGPDTLKARQWVADREFDYPREDVMLNPGQESANLLASALSQVPSRPAAAPILLATAARMPDAIYIGPLANLEHLAREVPALRLAGTMAMGLLDVLDHDRTPTAA